MGELGDNVDLFAREETSYLHLQSNAGGARVMIADDMAFGIDIEQLMLCRVPLTREAFAPKRLFRRYRWMLCEWIRRKLFGHTVINCIRVDSERSDIRLPRYNVDLSKLLKCGRQSPELAARASRMMFESLNRYEQINTNRLHVAVAGALLGKRVCFYPNSYHKCRSVYDYSMQGKFPELRWMGETKHRKICYASFLSEIKPSSKLRMRLQIGDRSIDSYVRSQELDLVPRGEALAAVGIMLAMREGALLQIKGSLDKRFQKGLTLIGQMHHSWDSSLKPLQFRCDQNVVGREEGNRVGLFFSGGADSFYSLLENLDEVTDLIFVHGFDIAYDWRDLSAKAEAWVREVGEFYGKRVICIETDIRSRLLDSLSSWGHQGHGVAMAAVAHLLSSDFKRLLIAASHSQSPYIPWGTHPKLDPLWSRGGFEFLHDHAGVSRVEKIRRLSEESIARTTLRVCWKNRGGNLNCGRCEKCLRTMLILSAFGVLDEFQVFAEPLRMHRVLRMTIPLTDIAYDNYCSMFHFLAQMPGCKMKRFALRVAFLRRFLKARCQPITRKKKVACPYP